jgi:signal transduction histidine kinase
LGLEVALEQLAGDVNESTGVLVAFKVTGKSKKISDDVGLVLFRIAQEALNNAQKHSRASRIRISLDYRHGKVTLVINDNGKGFDLETVFHSALDRGNLGLFGMRERAKLIGATFNIESKIARGTRVTVEVEQ